MKTEQEYHAAQQKLLSELAEITKKIKPLKDRQSQIASELCANDDEFMARIRIDWTQTEHALPPA